MSISATGVQFDEYTMWVDLLYGLTLCVSLSWFLRGAAREGLSRRIQRAGSERDRAHCQRGVLLPARRLRGAASARDRGGRLGYARRRGPAARAADARSSAPDRAAAAVGG